MATRRKLQLTFLPDILFNEDEHGVTVRAGRHRAHFPAKLEISRYSDNRPPRERAEEHGEALRKSYSSRRPSYRFHYTARGAASADEYNERRAIHYARWLASRDGVNIPDVVETRAVWSGIESATKSRWCKRIAAVEFGKTREQWNIVGTGRNRRGETTKHWHVAVRIEIPNWDFEAAEPVEEIMPEPNNTPVARSFCVPLRLLTSSCLVRVRPAFPVAPSCVLRVAA